jgi:hypothetical protein
MKNKMIKILQTARVTGFEMIQTSTFKSTNSCKTFLKGKNCSLDVHAEMVHACLTFEGRKKAPINLLKGRMARNGIPVGKLGSVKKKKKEINQLEKALTFPEMPSWLVFLFFFILGLQSAVNLEIQSEHQRPRSLARTNTGSFPFQKSDSNL